MCTNIFVSLSAWDNHSILSSRFSWQNCAICFIEYIDTYDEYCGIIVSIPWCVHPEHVSRAPGMENLNCDQCSVSDTTTRVEMYCKCCALLNLHCYEPHSTPPPYLDGFKQFQFGLKKRFFVVEKKFCSPSRATFCVQDTLLICLAIYLQFSKLQEKFNFKSQTNTSASKAH